MKHLLHSAFISSFAMAPAFAGTQQDFFVTSVKGATQVSVTRIGPDLNPDGSIRPHRLLVSSNEAAIRRIAAAIEIEDPKPTHGAAGEKTWAASSLSSSVPDFCIIFYRADKILLHYDLSESLTFVAVLGPHAKQALEATMDYPLTKESTEKMKRLIDPLVKTQTPNQPLQPTAPSRRG